MRSVLNKSKQKAKIQPPTITKTLPSQSTHQIYKESKDNWTQTFEPFTTKKSSDNDTSKEFDCDLNLLQQQINSIATATEKDYKYGQSSPICNCLKKSQKGNSLNSQSDSRLINWRELSMKIKELEEQIIEISLRYQKRETHLIHELEQKRIKWIVKYHELKQDAEKMKEFYEKGKSVWKFYLTTLHEALSALQFFQQEQNTKNMQVLKQVMAEISEINNLVISNHYSGAVNNKAVLNESQFQYTNRFDSQPTSCSRNLDQTSNQPNSHHQLSHFHQNSHHQINPNQSTTNLQLICSKINSALKKTEEVSLNIDGLINVKKNNKLWTQQQVSIMERIELLLRQNQKISFISSTPEQSSMMGNGQEGSSSIKKQSFIQQQQSNVLSQIIKNNMQIQDSQSKRKKDSSSPKRNDFLSLAAQFSPRTLKREVDGSYQFKASNIEDYDEFDKKSETTQKEFVINDESLNYEVQKRKSFSSQKKQEIEQRYSRDLCIIRRLFHDVSNSLHLSDNYQYSNGYVNKYEDSTLTKNSMLGDEGLLFQSQNLQNGLQTPLKSNQKNQIGNTNNNTSTSYILKNNQLMQSVQSMMVPSFFTMSDAKSHQQTQRILNNVYTLQKSDIDNNNLTYSQDDDGSISNLIYSRKSNGLINPQYDSIFTSPLIQSDTKQNPNYKMDEKSSNQFSVQPPLKGIKSKASQIDNFQHNQAEADDSRSELTIKEDYSMSSTQKGQNRHYF